MRNQLKRKYPTLTTAQAAPSCSAQLSLSQFGRACDELSRAELSRAVAALSPAEETVAWTVHELRGNIPLVKLSVSDPSQPDETNHYITGVPFSRSDIPAGRWTRTSIAYDVERQQCVLLTDSWWVIFLDITLEGEIYKCLNHNSVPNIPLYFRAGDVGNSNFHTSSTHKFNDEYGLPCLSVYLTPHRHYRLVLDTVGRWLETFKCSQELINAVYDALVGKFPVCYLPGIA